MSGKTAEFEQLFNEHYIKVYKLAMGLAGNDKDAEEITQEAFIRAFRYYHTFSRESSFFTWIYRITLNVAHDFLKQRTKPPINVLIEDLGYPIEQIIDPDPANDPETVVLANELRFKCLHCFTECLPPRQRQVFCLVLILGLSYKETAEILDCSLGVVKVTLHRGKSRVVGYLEDRCQLVKKSNPCNCRQWVRLALSQGWLSKKDLANPRPTITPQFQEEIVNLETLRSIYQNLYPETIDKALTQRIKQGIKNKEWTIFS